MARTMFWLPILVLLSACGGNMAGHAGHGAGSGIVTAYGRMINWYHLEEGKEVAWLQEKPMLVDFYVGEGCSRCEAMNRDVYSHPDLARQINAEFVPILVDLTRNLTRDEMALGEKYGYNFDCLLLFLDYRGDIVENAGGGQMCFTQSIDSATFAKYLTHASVVASR